MINTVEFRSVCPVATGLDILGDKWTLLILRDMIWGHKSLFSEFKESPEHMPSKMLSNRLKKLDCSRFISRSIFSYKDPFLLEKQLTDDEKTIKDIAFKF